MSNDVPHRDSITIESLTKPEGQFGWPLGKHGKLAEPSDRPFPATAAAFENAKLAIEIGWNPSGSEQQ